MVHSSLPQITANQPPRDTKTPDTARAHHDHHDEDVHIQPMYSWSRGRCDPGYCVNGLSTRWALCCLTCGIRLGLTGTSRLRLSLVLKRLPIHGDVSLHVTAISRLLVVCAWM